MKIIRCRFLSIIFAVSAVVTLSAQNPNTLLHSIVPAPSLQSGAQLGFSVAVDGPYTVVGAPYDETGATDSGVVKVFNSTTGELVHLLPHPVPALGDNFGYSVSISGTRVVVGAIFEDTGAIAAGRAYVYDLAGSTPTVPIFTLNNPSPAQSDSFGNSVAISGTLVVVGTAADDTAATDSGSVYVYDLSSPTPTVPVATLSNPSPAASDNFGRSVGISGTRLVVGAYRDDTGATNSGSAYVYDLTSGTPTVPVTILNNPNPAVSDEFGNAVAIAGTNVVVGAYLDDTDALSGGSVYLYDVSSGTPSVPIATLINPSVSKASDQFGSSISISATRIVVGAWGNNSGASSAGSAYVYDLNSGTPAVSIATLDNPSPAVGDMYGNAVAVSGTRIVVGAFQDDTGATNAGSAYVYELSSGTPTVPVAALNNPGPVTSDRFGSSVAISGTLMVVGVPQDDTGATDAGRAYVYDLTSATPTVPVITLNNPAPSLQDYFGFSVAISGTRIIVGAYRDDPGGTDAGSAYVYDISGASPTVPVATLNNPDPAAFEYFGFSVAISATRLVVGAWADDTGAADAGRAYVYDLASGTPTVPVTTLNNPSPAASDYFGYSVAISNTQVLVGAYQDDTGTTDAGSAYVYDIGGATPTVPVLTLNNPSPAAFDWYGKSVGISGTRVVIGALGDETGAANAGSAYVYDLSGGTPTVPVATLSNPSPTAQDFFSGGGVAISGARVVVGVNQDDTGASAAGTSYVYDLSGGTPTVPVATLNNPSPVADDQFGYSVAISGTTVVIGAPYDDTTALDEGAAYIFVPGPEIVIEQPIATDIPDGGSKSFGSVNVGSSSSLTFTVKNLGGTDLAGLAITKDGSHSSMFTITAHPAAPVSGPNGSTTFTVQFDPSSTGTKAAVLHIATNDSDENPFDITLTGTGVCPTIIVGNPTITTGSVGDVFSQAFTQNGGLGTITFSVASGSPPAGLALSSAGILSGTPTQSGTFSITVRATDAYGCTGTSTAYALLIKSNNADLSSLTLSYGTLAPGFVNNTVNYNASVPFGKSTLTVTPLAAHASSTLTVNGTAVISGSASGTIALSEGANAITTIVTAQDGTTTKTYIVNVTRTTTAPGDPELAFNPSIDGSAVRTIAVQPDGKAIIAGSFTSVNGVPRNNIARLNANGSLDMGFDPNTGSDVTSVALQADGKILLGGYFTTLQPNGAASAVARSRIARINADGSLDSSFDPNANGSVNIVAMQADGKIILGGGFTTLQPNGAASATARSRIARINADGSLDTGFNPRANFPVYCAAVQADGKVLLGGQFTTLQPNEAAGPTARRGIARVNVDGSLDVGFDPNPDNWPNSALVSCLAVQADGKVLFGGAFYYLQPNGAAFLTSRHSVARVHADGSVDNDFDPKPNSGITNLALQVDGKILLGGSFSSLQPNGALSPTSRRAPARVNSNGNLDTTFDHIGISDYSTSMAVQADGNILVGVVSDSARDLIRLHNGAASQTLCVPDATQVLWVRGGSTPETSSVTFHLSINGGATWTTLGNGTRVGTTANWQLTGLSLPVSGQLLACGRTTDGRGGSGLVEAVSSFTIAPPSGIYLDGPSVVNTNSQTQYRVMLPSGGGSPVDVTSSSTLGFSVAPGVGVGIGGSYLFVSADALTQTVYLRGTYNNGAGGTTSAPFAVNVQTPLLAATASMTGVHQSGSTYTVTVTGSASGGTPPYAYNWDTTGRGLYGDLAGSSGSFNVFGSGTYHVSLKVADANQITVYRDASVTLNKPAVANQPTTQQPAPDPTPNDFKDSSGDAFEFQTARIPNGLLVITHGMLDNADSQWLKDIAIAIENRLGTSCPNIVLFDWREGAKVSLDAQTSQRMA
ncbi:MAG: choice-of-anchor D domain-containing protein, partial [Fimbriimonadaceae bacterium]